MVKIKLLFIESYSSSAVENKAFLNQFHRSNQKIAKIKKDILFVFNDLQNDSRFKLISETGKALNFLLLGLPNMIRFVFMRKFSQKT